MPKSEDRKTFKKPLVIITLLLRLLAAFYILFDPFWGILISMLVDTFDNQFLMRRAGMSRDYYEIFDKRVDWVTYIIMLYVASFTDVFGILLVLLAFRFIGWVLFEKTKNERYLVYFPNFYELAFFAFVSINYQFGVDFTNNLYIWLIIFVVQIAREYLLHIYWPVRLGDRSFI